MSETKTDEELAREWVTDFGGEWHAGMRCFLTGRICIDVSLGGHPVWHLDERKADGSGGGLPDLSHPGTRAFLLEDVRKALGARVWPAMWLNGSGWYVLRLGEDGQTEAIPCATFDTEQAALMAALRAAPGEEARRG